jgi:hypothetical protein
MVMAKAAAGLDQLSCESAARTAVHDHERWAPSSACRSRSEVAD